MAWRPTFPEAADQLFVSGDALPCIVVFVDGWTRYGGSQYVDSPGTGAYHTYLDEWYLDLGMQAFVKELDAIGVTDVRHELFDAKHGGIDYRYPLSLAYLAEHLAV